MTEKRFIPIFDGTDKRVVGAKDNGKIISFMDMFDLLNDLSEDNEYLEKRFKEEEWHYDHIDEDRDVWKYKCQELEKENEQLKSTINTLTCDNTKMKKVLNTTKNENEQIKQVIKEAYQTERTALGKSVLKQILDNVEGEHEQHIYQN